MSKIVRRFMQDERGEDVIEDSLLVGFLALLAIAIWSRGFASAHGLWSSMSCGLDPVLN